MGRCLGPWRFYSTISHAVTSIMEHSNSWHLPSFFCTPATAFSTLHARPHVHLKHRSFGRDQSDCQLQKSKSGPRGLRDLLGVPGRLSGWQSQDQIPDSIMLPPLDPLCTFWMIPLWMNSRNGVSGLMQFKTRGVRWRRWFKPQPPVSSPTGYLLQVNVTA